MTHAWQWSGSVRSGHDSDPLRTGVKSLLEVGSSGHKGVGRRRQPGGQVDGRAIQPCPAEDKDVTQPASPV